MYTSTISLQSLQSLTTWAESHFSWVDLESTLFLSWHISESCVMRPGRRSSGDWASGATPRFSGSDRSLCGSPLAVVHAQPLGPSWLESCRDRQPSREKRSSLLPGAGDAATSPGLLIAQCPHTPGLAICSISNFHLQLPVQTGRIPKVRPQRMGEKFPCSIKGHLTHFT